MLSEADLNRLNGGSSRMALVAFVLFILIGLVLCGVGCGRIGLAARLAEVIHVQLWDLFAMKFDFKQSYSGAIVGAADLLSSGLRNLAEGIVLLWVAFLMRGQAKFYARLRAELQGRDA